MMWTACTVTSSFGRLEVALSIHSKARVVLQCWVLLILRRRAGMRHEKDALYDRLQLTPVNPQEKMRYRRGAMLLCHLLRRARCGDWSRPTARCSIATWSTFTFRGRPPSTSRTMRSICRATPPPSSRGYAKPLTIWIRMAAR